MPKPHCPISDFDELDRFVEQFNTYIEYGESIIGSGDMLVQGLLLGGIKSWKESLNELVASECIQPAKAQLEDSCEAMEKAIGTSQTGNISKAKKNFTKALDSFETFNELTKELTEE